MTKEVAIAAFFGRGELVDAFAIAYMGPSFLVALLATSMNAALVPTFIQEFEQRGSEAAYRLLSSAMVASQALLVGFSLLLAALGPLLLGHLASGFTPEKLHLTVRLFWALLPIIVLSGFGSNCAAVLNACGRFAAAALTPMLTPAITLVVLLMQGRNWSIWSLVAGALAGALAEALILWILLSRAGIPIRLRWYGRTPALRVVLSQYLPVILAGLLSSGTTIVDQSVASILAPGSVAALMYAGKIVGVFASLTTFALGTAVMPYFSQMVAKGDWRGCRETLRTYTGLLYKVMIPVSLLLAALSPVIIRLLFEHGAFTSQDTALVARMQAVYAVQLVCSGASLLYVRMLTALRRNELLTLISALNFGLNIFLDLTLIRWFGVVGIAMATSLFYICTLASAAVMCGRVLRRLERDGKVQAQLGHDERTWYYEAAPITLRPRMAMAKYLLRIDDLCPTMNSENWHRVERVLTENGIRPLIAIVPDNRDPALIVDTEDSSFWHRMVAAQEAGWEIAQHGYQHVTSVRGRSLTRLHTTSEFAGLAESEQYARIAKGRDILRSRGLEPTSWVAPRHGLDHITVRVLRELGFNCNSDGFALWPFERDGTFWIPQQLWAGASKRFGVWTICLHINHWTAADFQRFETFIRRHADDFLSASELRRTYGSRRESSLDRAFRVYWHARLNILSVAARCRPLRRLVTSVGRSKTCQGRR
jgi:putative peptidoglycan lipid II flippase